MPQGSQQDNEPTPLRRAADEGEQVSAFAPAPGQGEPPPGYVRPPSGDQFDNATHLVCGPEVDGLIEKVLGYDEFKDLGEFRFGAVWRKKTKPTRAGVPVYVTVDVAPLLWRYLTEGACPHYAVNLHWQHFDDLRNESQFVHPETLERHIHAALMTLTVSEELQIGKQAPTVQVFPETVRRYGLHEQPLVQLQGAFDLWHDKAARAKP